MSVLWAYRKVKMLKNEIRYLIIQKEKEGKTIEEIGEDICELVLSQEAFKHIKKDNQNLDNRINKASKKIEKLRTEIKTRDKEIFRLKHLLGINQMNRNNKGITLNDLKKILSILTPKEKISQTKICELTGIEKKKIKPALIFLKRNNLLKKTSGGYSQCN